MNAILWHAVPMGVSMFNTFKAAAIFINKNCGCKIKSPHPNLPRPGKVQFAGVSTGENLRDSSAKASE